MLCAHVSHLEGCCVPMLVLERTHFVECQVQRPVGGRVMRWQCVCVCVCVTKPLLLQGSSGSEGCVVYNAGTLSTNVCGDKVCVSVCVCVCKGVCVVHIYAKIHRTIIVECSGSARSTRHSSIASEIMAVNDISISLLTSVPVTTR